MSTQDIADEAVREGIVASISGTTVWRWLNEDAIRPWRHRSWIFPRDPDFAQLAGVVIDLYHRIWHGNPLKADEYVICADEKTNIQIRARLYPTLSTGPGRSMRVEHEYERGGSFVYLAAWDVGRAKLFGHCELHNGIAPFRRLVNQVMSREPYRSARRVFWITDNGSAHRGPRSVKRLQTWYKNALLVHTPVHASWLNQIEIYFSVVQRKVLTPANASSQAKLIHTIINFQKRYEKMASPFEWKFTRKDLRELMKKLAHHRDLDK